MVLTAQYDKDKARDEERIRRERARSNVDRSALNYTKSIVDVVSLNPEALAKVIEGENLNSNTNRISDKQFGMELAMLVGATVAHKAGGYAGRREGQEVTAEALRRDSRFNLYGRSALIEALKNMSAEEVIAFAKAENIRLGKNPRLTTLAIETAIQNVRDVGVYDLVATHLKSVNMKVINNANKMLRKEGLPTMTREQFLEIYTKEKNRTTFKKNKTSDYTNPTVDELNGFITSQARHYAIGKELGTMTEREAYESGYKKLPLTEEGADRIEMTQAQKDAAVREKAISDELLGIRRRRKPIPNKNVEDALEQKDIVEKEKEQMSTNKKTDKPIYPKEAEAEREPLRNEQVENALEGDDMNLEEAVEEVEEQTVGEREADREPIRQEELEDALEGEDVADREEVPKPDGRRRVFGKKSAIATALIASQLTTDDPSTYTAGASTAQLAGGGTGETGVGEANALVSNNMGEQIIGTSSRIIKGTANIDELFTETMRLSALSYDIGIAQGTDYRFLTGTIPTLLWKRGDTLFITFRGTASLDNLKTNLNFAAATPSAAPNLRGYKDFSKLSSHEVFVRLMGPYLSNISFHTGFVNALATIIESLIEQISSYGTTISNLIVTGHSLGGAIATVFTYVYQNIFTKLSVKNQNNRLPIRYTITYGSPRTLIDEGSNEEMFYNNVNEIIRVFNSNDVITYLPFKTGVLFNDRPYIHVGKPYCVDAEILDNNINYLIAKMLKNGRPIIESLIMNSTDNIAVKGIKDNLQFMLKKPYLEGLATTLQECVNIYDEPPPTATPAMLQLLSLQLYEKSGERDTWIDKCSLLRDYGLESMIQAIPMKGESEITEDFTIATVVPVVVGNIKTGFLSHKMTTYKYYIDQLISREIDTGLPITIENKRDLQVPPNQEWITEENQQVIPTTNSRRRRRRALNYEYLSNRRRRSGAPPMPTVEEEEIGTGEEGLNGRRRRMRHSHNPHNHIGIKEEGIHEKAELEQEIMDDEEMAFEGFGYGRAVGMIEMEEDFPSGTIISY